MHMQGTPATMQQNPQYDNVVSEVISFFAHVIDRAVAAGVDRRSIVLDPGIGFGKQLTHNMLLLQALPELRQQFQLPLLVGISRKRLIADLLAERAPAEPAQRDHASHVLHAQLASHCDMHFECTMLLVHMPHYDCNFTCQMHTSCSNDT